MHSIVSDVTKLLRFQPSVPRTELWRWVTVSGLLTLIVLGSAAGSQFRIRFPDIHFTVEPPEFDMLGGVGEAPPTDGAMPMAPNLGRNIGILLVAIAALVLLGIVAYFTARFFWKRRGRLRDGMAAVVEEPAVDSEPVQFSRQDVADIVATAQSRMAQAGNPSDAVVAGWLAFEEAAATRGWVREPHETTTEFTDRLLAKSPVPAKSVATLRSLYQKVRFGSRVPTESDVAAAHTALTEIAESLRDVLDEREISTLRTVAAKSRYPEPLLASGSLPIKSLPIKSGVTRNKWGED